MPVEKLTAISDIGPIIAKSIVEFLSEPINITNIEMLANAGVQMQLSEDKLSDKNNLLTDKTIVISGTFTHHSRDEYKEIIEKSGGKNSSSISKKTSFVLAGENMGHAKYEKCQALGVQIINEDEFLNMLNFNKT